MRGSVKRSEPNLVNSEHRLSAGLLFFDFEYLFRTFSCESAFERKVSTRLKRHLRAYALETIIAEKFQAMVMLAPTAG
jgi:hypothetical protein